MVFAIYAFETEDYLNRLNDILQIRDSRGIIPIEAECGFIPNVLTTTVWRDDMNNKIHILQ